MNAPYTQTARSIRCSQCGNSFSIDGLAETVQCSHCGGQQIVDPQLLAELRGFRTQVYEQSQAARRDRGVAAAWEQTAAQMEKGSGPGQVLLAFGLVAGIPMLAVLLGIFLLHSDVIPKENVYIVNGMAMVGAAIGLTLYFILYYSRRGRSVEGSSRIATAIKCPECGASNPFGSSPAVASCSHCGAGLIPNAGTRDAVVDAAREDRRRAQMAKLRAERSGYAAIAKVGMGPVALVWMIGGSFLLMVGGGSVAFSYEMFIGNEPYSPAILVMWILTFALVGGMRVITKNIRRRQARTQAAVADLAEAFGGRGLDGLAGTARWLNTYWTGPVDPYKMMPGSYYGCAEMIPGGFPTFVDVNPVAASQHHRAYCSILVACHIPDASDGKENQITISAKARDIRKRIDSAGFNVQLTEAGIHASSVEELPPTLKKPENIDVLSGPIADMVRLAAALDATPAAAIP
ncbi:MAG: hypothetical protein GY854_08345 [Deltaproteobacteria bacterium]|nr:hypothetical protein [Deltaproteobacteria bacterium]